MRNVWRIEEHMELYDGVFVAFKTMLRTYLILDIYIQKSFSVFKNFEFENLS